jgi:hypothetical protein
MSTSTVAADSTTSEIGRINASLRGAGPGSPLQAGRQSSLPGWVRPGRRTGRGARPQARPDQSVSAPRSFPGSAARVRGCAPAAPARGQVGTNARWRLTERGVAVVLVTLAMVATAALAVVSLTALRVTGSGYQAGAGQYAAQR